MSIGRDFRFWHHRQVFAMTASSRRGGRGNFKLKNKKKDYVYIKTNYHHAIHDIRIELCKSSFYYSENTVIGAGNVSKVP